MGYVELSCAPLMLARVAIPKAIQMIGQIAFARDLWPGCVTAATGVDEPLCACRRFAAEFLAAVARLNLPAAGA